MSEVIVEPAADKPEAKDDLKSLPMPEVEENWGRYRMASVKPRRKSALPNMGPTKLKNGKPISS
jgi:hypothetical protein